jgi:hypothetical protein
MTLNGHAVAPPQYMPMGVGLAVLARPEAFRDASLFILPFLGLSFGRAGIVVRANVTDHADSPDLNLDPGSGKVCHGD